MGRGGGEGDVGKMGNGFGEATEREGWRVIGSEDAPPLPPLPPVLL